VLVAADDPRGRAEANRRDRPSPAANPRGGARVRGIRIVSVAALIRADGAAAHTRSNRLEVFSMDDVLTRAQARVAKDLRKELNGPRWALGIRGVAAIAFAAVILIWPSISLYALTLVFGAFNLFFGVMTLSQVFAARKWQTKLWLLLLAAVDIGIGIAVIVWPDISTLALLYVIGAYAIAIGLVVLSGPLWIPGMSGGDVVLLVLNGLVSIAFGVVMFSKPGDGALVLLALIAAFSIVSGVTQITFALAANPERLLGLKGGKRRQTAGATA
jgi:uncharacterized membrane protein HdeD (DUF308 family)